MKELNPAQKQAIEAEVFNTLRLHLDRRKDVQNIELMELAGFCRNCLSRWYAEAAAKRGLKLNKEQARQIIYGMPYQDWKAKYQK